MSGRGFIQAKARVTSRERPGIRKWLLVVGLGLSMPAFGLDTIQLSETQRQRLNVVTQFPRGEASIPLGVVPAQVSVPPENNQIVSAPLGGVVRQIWVSNGDRVRSGQVLIHIVSPELLQHQHRLIDAWNELRVAEAKHSREKPLFRDGILSRRRWLETEKTWRQTRTAFSQARHELVVRGLAQTTIEQLLQTGRLDSRLSLKAPVDGVVTERTVEVGEWVDRADPLLKVMVLNPLWLEMAAPVAVAEKLKVGALVYIEDDVAAGKVILVADTVDPITQTVLVRAELSESIRLRPGLRISARLAVPEPGVLKIPSGALVEQQGRHVVFVKTTEGFEARTVKIVAKSREAVYIHEGIEPGEAVVVQGVVALKAAWLGHGEEE